MAAKASSTILQDRELSRLADLFPGEEYLRVADYFDIDRTRALNINHNLHGHAHSVITEYLSQWRNRNQDGDVEIREMLLNVLDVISMEQGWFMPGKYEFLKLISHTRGTLPVQESQPHGAATKSSSSSATSPSQRASSSQQRPELYRVPRMPTGIPQQYPGDNPHYVQQGNKKNVQDHRILNKIAGTITDWDEINTLGLELDCDPNEIQRLTKENISIKGAAYKILSSFYEGVAKPDKEKWAKVRSAMIELEKMQSIVDLGIDKLCMETNANTQVPVNTPRATATTGGGSVAQPMRQTAPARNNPTGIKPASAFQTKPNVAPRPPSFADSARQQPGDLGGGGGGGQVNLGVEQKPQTFTISPELRKVTAGYDPVSSIDELKNNLATMTASRQAHPKGIPITGGLKALALADDSFQDYSFLHLAQMQTAAAAEARRNKPVVVAVLDTGIYTDHPQLRASVKQNKNFVKDYPGKPYKEHSDFDLQKDYCNHGTLVAGLVTKYGPVNVRILNYKVLPTHLLLGPGNRVTSVNSPDGTLEDFLEALNYISTLDNTEHQVDIINMSFGNNYTSPDLDAKLTELSATKVLIAAAGNDGARAANTVQWPAKHDNVICVGGCNTYGKRMDMSANGRVDFMCPGENVRSTAGKLIQETDTDDPGHFATNGTSLATPIATAVAANVISIAGDADLRPQVTSTRVMRSILSSMGSKVSGAEMNDGTGLLKPAEFFDSQDFIQKLRDRCREAVSGKI